ncbi:MAG: MoxR family ATPase [Acidimicrobiales bacterium]
MSTTASLAASPTHVARALVENVASVVLGKREKIELVVEGLLAGGHVLLEDVPGVGKTLLSKSLAASLGGTMGRVQGTADLMPSDITGVTVWDPGARLWELHPGPLFHNVVLVDEINRATPRAQSALLEAMAEEQVTLDGAARPLPPPFFVIATQNPAGETGTFPLGEGQCDRFTLTVSLGLPDRDAERAIILGKGGPDILRRLEPVVDGPTLTAAIAATEAVQVLAPVSDYVLDLVAATRSHPQLSHGASPRAARILLRVAKAHAVMAGRDFVTPDDVKAVAAPVLAHRLGAISRAGTPAARALVSDLLTRVPAPPA